MTDGAESYKYWAFISYSHQDRAWCDWLHRGLERYRVPTRLVGQDARHGEVPRRIFPVFRDREELPTSADLGNMLVDALHNSRYLIVICSPASARSQWVAEEIRTFKALGRSNRVLCLIVDGEPNASDKPDPQLAECFPEPIRYEVDENGQLTESRCEPIAADARPQGDGRRDALLKLIAGVLGVGFDALKQRELAARQRRMAIVSGMSLALATVMAVLMIMAVIARNEALRRYDQMVTSLDNIIFDTERATAHIAGTADLRRSLMTQALEHLDALADERDSVQIRDGRGRGYIRVARALGDPYEPNLGQTEEAEAAVIRGIELLESIRDESPDPRSVTQALVAGYVVHGDLLSVSEGPQAALTRFADAEALALELRAAAPTDQETLTNYSRLKGRMGDMLRLLGQVDEAVAAYEESAAIKLSLLGFQRGQVPPMDRLVPEIERDLRRDYAITVGARAEILQSLQRLGEARTLLEEAYAIHDDLLRNFPGHALYRRDIANVSYRIGVLQQETGDLDLAYRNHRRALDQRRNFFELEPHDNMAVHAYWVSVGELSRLDVELGRPDQAIQGLQLYRWLTERLMEQRPEVPDYAAIIVQTLSEIAAIHLQQGQVDEGRAVLVEAISLAEGQIVETPAPDGAWRELGRVLLQRGLVAFVEGVPEAGRGDFERAIDAAEIALQDSADDLGARTVLGTAVSTVALLDELLLETADVTAADRETELRRIMAEHERAIELLEPVAYEQLGMPGGNVLDLINSSLDSIRFQLNIED